MQESDIQAMIEKWDDCRKNIDLLEKKIKRYRSQMENYMQTNNLDVYETSKFKVKKNVQQRALLTKKMVPKEIWNTYSLPQRIEFLSLTDKTLSKKKKSN